MDHTHQDIAKMNEHSLLSPATTDERLARLERRIP